MDYSDSNEVVDVEVVRLQSNYAKEDADELESVKCLCKAFSFGLKMAKIHADNTRFIVLPVRSFLKDLGLPLKHLS